MHSAHEDDDLSREDRQPEDLTMHERPLDLEAVRAKLQSTSGKQYWRTLEEFADDPHFAELLHREFPRQASQWDDTVERRDFLKLMAASLAFGGLAGCKSNEQANIVPYVKQPSGMVLGKPLYFATAMPMGADAVGILVESHEGRPTKIEGNPDHPSSLGATDAITQASILDLYDPDRARTTTFAGEIRTWSAFLDSAQAQAALIKGSNGAGLRILTGTVTSPTLIQELQYLLKLYPQAKWHQWEPARGDAAYEGAKLAFGRYVNTVYRPERAEVILSLDSDFLASGPGHIRYHKEFYRRRKLDQYAEADRAGSEMSRLYAVEPTPSVTGSNADHRLPLRSAEIEQFARALASKLGLGGSATPPSQAENFLDGVAKELRKFRGKSLVIAGEYQPAAVHALAHAINSTLGNVGNTLYYTEPVEGQPTNQLESLRELCADMEAGRVDTLVILGGNPVYDAPHDFDFAAKLSLQKVRNSVYVSSHFNETAEYCQWHVAESHYLEAWSDARAFDGTISVIQPLIAPLYRTRSARDVLAAFSDKPGGSDYDAVRERLRSSMPTAPNAAAEFEKYWRKTLNDGVVADTAYPAISISPKFSIASLPPAKETQPGELEVLFRPDPCVYDGRFANNGWLQELPKPITKLTWDNAAMMSPNTAWNHEVKHVVAARGGEHGQILATLIDIALSNSKVTAAAWILPGQADNVIVLPLGYGRKSAGFTGTNKGFNAYAVRASDALWTAYGPKITKTGDQYSMACTQYHFNIEGRKILSAGTLEEYKKNPAFTHEGDEQPPKSLSLYKEFSYPGYAWGMAIDLNSCNGCNACVVACVAENNIPVVGKDQVLRGREMHWIRIDRYYEAPTRTNDPRTNDNDALANPPTFFQPVPCMQCENAPCEQVCPVAATTHSAEGLNDMVYNRCIGTRYCSNNCPYKVRRFNFLRFQDWETPQYKLMRNPEVTVRSRGVMEKCTYCVQRINNARIESEKQNRAIRDGEIITACAQACPSEAIVFGNANDPNSRVAKLKAQQRNYAILGELNSRPRTTYLAAVRNPNPELEKA